MPEPAKVPVAGHSLINCILISRSAVTKDQQWKSSDSIVFADALNLASLRGPRTTGSGMVAVDALNATGFAFHAACGFDASRDSSRLILPAIGPEYLPDAILPGMPRILPVPAFNVHESIYETES
jgi:hypothetical protein